MRILDVSDLHLEFPQSRYEPPRHGYDVVVLAGDIHGRIAYALKRAAWPEKIGVALRNQRMKLFYISARP